MDIWEHFEHSMCTLNIFGRVQNASGYWLSHSTDIKMAVEIQ